MDFKNIIRDIPDFPQKGILFRDITTVLKDKEALYEAIDELSESIKDLDFDYVVGPESRGFIFGVLVAYKLKKGFVPIRKKGKLPFETVRETYNLEYGSATIEMHKDAIKNGDRVVIVDDLLATGGTSKAAANLIEKMGGNVIAMNFFIELENLKGRELLSKYVINSVVKY